MSAILERLERFARLPRVIPFSDLHGRERRKIARDYGNDAVSRADRIDDGSEDHERDFDIGGEGRAE